MSRKGLLSGLLCLVLMSSGHAGELQQLALSTRFDSAHWHSGGDQFACTLEQAIEGFGTAVFERKAGQKTVFSLLARTNFLKDGRASIVAEPPLWAPDKPRHNLGYVNVSQGAMAVELKPALSHRLLIQLINGMAPTFQRVAWFDSAQVIDVALSSAYFKGAYGEFGQCAGSLLPKSYQQIERTRVHFKTNMHGLTSEAIAALDIIAQYVDADDSVNKIYVDGHTDDVFSQDYNISLSKKRAKTVSAYLAKAGIKKTKVVTRYHGERYPVVPNKDDASRTKNRRVTVRLER